MKARQHTDGIDSSGDTTVALPVIAPRLTAHDVIGTYLALRSGLWVNADAVRAVALSHGIGLDDFTAAAANMIANGRIMVVDGHWCEGFQRSEGDS